MPLNKLENFIKNTEGRILYVNPNDLDATDAIENQGNSLTKPFKTIQRALLESARFSYVAGNNNDLVEKTTILLFPGEHIIDNRPGFGIKDDSGARAVSPAGTETDAQTTLTLTANSNFDLTQENNILYRFNSINGGVVVPRGTSIVGLDLRKTKLRPKYVPNPTDGDVAGSAIFRVTGACYFWQFSIFDGDENTVVYTDPVDFSTNNRSKPTFSHHKLTCFEYADGVTVPAGFALTDLEQYYAKLSNAFNPASGRDISNKWPASEEGFAPQLPEYQIVGAFATDPINISDVVSGDGTTPTSVITVTTADNHNLSVGTPISISGVNVVNYNISAKVTNVISATQFTYSLPFVPPTLNANPGLSSAKVTVETDSVSGASPYIFNVSMRSVWGMNGMHADGARASGFRSMVVAQFTAVSLQKDDRAFVKYNASSRNYQSINVTKVTGASLSSGSSSTTSGTVYHLDPEAAYRPGWESRHIRASNDAIIQIVSVFAIGFANHFVTESGGDFSVTNSNSNFGQLSLLSDGFKREAFDRDNKAFITSIITPKAITSTEEEVEWVGIDTNTTDTVGISSHLYLLGFNDIDNKPSSLIQGYKVGAKASDQLFIRKGATEYTASVYMTDNVIAGTAQTATGTNSSFKSFDVSSIAGATGTITLSATHNFNTGEKVILIEDDGDLPEKIEEHQVYYVIDTGATTIQLASSKTNAENGTEITGIHYAGSKLHIISRVSDKESGDVGSPVQFDEVQGQWFIHTDANSNIYQNLALLTSDDIFFIKRTEDRRGLDEKLYKFRLVIPKEFEDTKDPEEGFILQESSSTGATADGDFTLSTLVNYPSADAPNPYQFEKNPSFISTCSVAANTVTVIAELPHNLNVGDRVIVRNVTSTDNTAGTINVGYNGTFAVTAVSDDKTFQYSTTDIDGVVHTPLIFTNDTSSRTTALPRFERNDWRGNYYIYRSEVIVPHEEGVQDGVYHLYVLAADYASPEEFTTQFFSQNVRDFYPQMDRDNIDDNPAASSTFARRNPVGDVVTSDLKKSLTREAADKVLQDFFIGLPINSVDNSTAGVSTITFSREHNLSGIVTYSALTGGSGYTNGTYYNVKLFNNGTSNWDGATAKVVVSGGAVTSAEIIAGGSGYTDAEELDFDTAIIGGGTGAGVTISTSGISTVIGNTLQITGIGTTAGGHFRITGVPADNQIAIARTAGDSLTVSGQYAINVGPEILINSTDNTTGFTTFTTVNPHGLVVGNKINILDNSNNNLGNYLVSPVGLGTTTFGVASNVSAANPTYVLKHGLDSNDRASDAGGENLGSRGLSFYANESLILQEDITSDTQFKVSTVNSGISTENRFPLGSYLQIGNEIMKIQVSGLTGVGNDEITVIRGVLGTQIQNHDSGSLIKKIDVRAVEYRRPSIIRASGHTFEYLGFGPGNYSTSLPQVQVRTLTEKEEFLAQSHQRSSGIVVYTGMNNRGDFYIGNKRVSSATGKEKVFGIPVPTITGIEPSELSVIFDEVTVKQRIFVEGGNNNNILSQFNGPVNFSQNVKLKGNTTTVEGTLQLEQDVFELKSSTPSTNVSSGALVVEGGVGIGGTVNIGGTLTVGSSSVVIDGSSGSESITVGTGATINQSGFTGSGAGLSNIPNSAMANATVSYGGVTLALGDSDATPAFDLTDATNYKTSNLSGTITNDQLAGSIANGKLANSSVSYGGIELSLGGSDATPAFNLTDATNYPVGSLANLGSGVATFLQSPISFNLKSAVTDATGSGALVFATSPTFTNSLTLGNGDLTFGEGFDFSYVVEGRLQDSNGSGTILSGYTHRVSTGIIGDETRQRNVAAFAYVSFDADPASSINDSVFETNSRVYSHYNVEQVTYWANGEWKIYFRRHAETGAAGSKCMPVVVGTASPLSSSIGQSKQRTVSLVQVTPEYCHIRVTNYLGNATNNCDIVSVVVFGGF